MWPTCLSSCVIPAVREAVQPRLARVLGRFARLAREASDHWRRDIDLWGTYEDGTYSRKVAFAARYASALETPVIRLA